MLRLDPSYRADHQQQEAQGRETNPQTVNNQQQSNPSRLSLTLSPRLKTASGSPGDDPEPSSSFTVFDDADKPPGQKLGGQVAGSSEEMRHMRRMKMDPGYQRYHSARDKLSLALPGIAATQQRKQRFQEAQDKLGQALPGIAATQQRKQRFQEARDKLGQALPGIAATQQRKQRFQEARNKLGQALPGIAATQQRKQRFQEARNKLGQALPGIAATQQRKQRFQEARDKLGQALPGIAATQQRKQRFQEARDKLGQALPGIAATQQRKQRFQEARDKLGQALPGIAATQQRKQRFHEARDKLAQALPGIVQMQQAKAAHHGRMKNVVNEIKNARTLTQIASAHLHANPTSYVDPYGLEWQHTPWHKVQHDRVDHVLHHNVDDPGRLYKGAPSAHGVFNDPGNPATHGLGGNHPDVAALAYYAHRQLPGGNVRRRRFTGEELIAVNRVNANGSIPDFQNWNVMAKGNAFNFTAPVGAPARTGTQGGHNAVAGHGNALGGYRFVAPNSALGAANRKTITFFPR
ncbi:hypothetical protein [Thalassomonas actiniarum]|uniref:hypothetical protein n=1 Tax=Thalassomonas actiniarum TaxID=485447 RepID=UPI002360F55A|nr:hypothetical protein [Thalassomonas actiniarum]